MPTRNVVLTQRHEKMISEMVSSGRYQNASEVLREGLRLVEERDARESAKLKALRKAARAGFSDLDQGRAQFISDDELEGTIAALGRQASQRG
ncbi:MAG: type II toxin-antitoxin system ParD family antitoxin [Alphaproteobacteria bacterium]|nr:type II toxin-antitoxin system ParD family antitoxin [Alphaproteobacteria bacterium]